MESELIEITTAADRFEPDEKRRRLLETVANSFSAWATERAESLRHGTVQKSEERADKEREKNMSDYEIAKRDTGRQAFLERHGVEGQMHGGGTREEYYAAKPSNTTGTIDPLDGFKAGVMQFKRSPKGWSGVDYRGEWENLYSGGFPNQQVKIGDMLYHEDHNPFEYERDRLKYIHLPANHMDWVEVSTSRPK